MTCETCEDAKRRLGPAGWKMLEERQVYKECLEMALKLVKAKDALLASYRVGVPPKDAVFKSLEENSLEQIHARLESCK